MAPGSILRIHAFISAALNQAVRYEWIVVTLRAG
jgi:hypothetical protein